MQPKTEAECRALFKGLPIAVVEAVINVSATLSCTGPLSLYDSQSSFAYLKFMETWMIVARHLRDDAIEFAHGPPSSPRPPHQQEIERPVKVAITCWEELFKPKETAYANTSERIWLVSHPVTTDWRFKVGVNRISRVS